MECKYPFGEYVDSCAKSRNWGYLSSYHDMTSARVSLTFARTASGGAATSISVYTLRQVIFVYPLMMLTA